MGLVALTASTAVVGGAAHAINSNPPTGPANVEIFPVRDMVGINGYTEYAGQVATFTVTRKDKVIGSAKGVVDATGFLEVNHPGGACWGDGTDLKVTPNIKGGDKVRVTFANGDWDEATTSDIAVEDVTSNPATKSLTFHGTYGPGVDMPGDDLQADPGKFGVEIVNPDMRDGTSVVGERAIGWPVEFGESVTGHTSTGVLTGSDETGGTFEVTYTFELASDLALAEAGEHVALAWMGKPADPEVEAQLGLTLFEYGEAGGPGMGECPAGPEEQRPGKPQDTTAKGVPGGVEVAWGEAQVAPESPAVEGYVVRAVDGEGNEIGKRLGGTARDVTLSGLTDGKRYTVEVSARSGAGESHPPVMMSVTAGEHVTPTASPRVVGATAGADGVYPPLMGQSGVEFVPGTGLTGGVRVYYTTDGSEPTLKSRVWDSGTSNPINLARTTTLRWFAQDDGNIRGALSEPQEIKIAQASAAAPTFIGTPVAKDGAADISFGVVDGATAYEVKVLSGGALVAEQEVTAAPVEGTITHTVTGLTNDTEYTFTVAALVGGVWTADSAPSEAVTPVPLPAANAGADISTFRARTVTLDGSTSKQAKSYSWKQVGTGDPTVTLSDPAAAKPTFTFPTIPNPGVPAADNTLEFELTITGNDDKPYTDTVVVTAAADSITATRNRYRQGRDLRLNGTATQDGAVLYFRDATLVGPNNNVANAPVIFSVTTANGAWAAPAAPTQLPGQPNLGLRGDRLHVTSSHGYVGIIQLTR